MSETIDSASEDAIFRIGRVIAVKGRAIEIRVDKTKNTSNLLYKGQLLKNIAVGGYIKIAKGFTSIIGKVEGEYITEDKLFTARPHYGSDKDRISRVLSVSLLGFFDEHRFERGIKELPLIDNECFLLKKDEFEKIHDFIRPGDQAITIGTLSFEKEQEIRVGVNSLFASHVGIFGNTGSGKSYTLAKLYHELFKLYKEHAAFKEHARFFFIDFNGEYTGDGTQPDDVIVENGFKTSFRLSTRSTTGGDKFPLAEETLTDPEFWVVFLEATEKTQVPFLRRAVGNSFLAPKIADPDEFKELLARMLYGAVEGDKNLDKAVVTNMLQELKDALHGNESLGTLLADYKSNLKYHSMNKSFYYQPAGGSAIYTNVPQFRADVIDAKVGVLEIDHAAIDAIDAIRLQILLQYYDDIIRGFANKEHLAPLIKRLDRRIDDLKKVVAIQSNGAASDRNITFVSLRDVNLQMRKVLPLLFCKKLYADKKKEGDDRKYLNIVIDEAHNILSEQSERESEQWKDYRLETFEEVIKEGRKFGVFLTLASQRPADISATIISQLHNYFLHRLINNEDINAVKQTVSYLDRVSFEYLPLLPTGTCIFAGLLANVPIVVDIGSIPEQYEPRNKTLTLTDKWIDSLSG